MMFPVDKKKLEDFEIARRKLAEYLAQNFGGEVSTDIMCLAMVNVLSALAGNAVKQYNPGIEEHKLQRIMRELSKSLNETVADTVEGQGVPVRDWRKIIQSN